MLKEWWVPYLHNTLIYQDSSIYVGMTESFGSPIVVYVKLDNAAGHRHPLAEELTLQHYAI